MEARQKVESVSLTKLKEWRDEAGEQSNELEETFREVIVLDDDDDESSDEDSFSTPNHRESSLEIVSNRATAQDLQPERHIEHLRADANGSRRMSRRTIFLQPYPPPRSTAAAGASHKSDQAILLRNPPPENRPRLLVEGPHLAHSRSMDR